MHPIETISQKHFGLKPKLIEQILDKGKVNQVFKVLIGEIPYIFRVNKKDYLSTYQREYFCITKAREENIPVSEVYYIGIEGENSYMILDYIEGVNGVDSPEEKHGEIYKMLGNYASKFNQIEVGGFGIEVKNEVEGFFEDWDTYYKKTINKIFGDKVLIDNKALTLEESENIKKRLSEMEKWNVKPRLCHGNLHITNTIIDPEGKIYVIDWGNGAGNMAPHVDLADLIAWKDRKYLGYFLEGYGISKEEFNNIEHEVNNLLIIQLLSVIKYAFEIDKKFLDKNFIKSSINRILSLN